MNKTTYETIKRFTDKETLGGALPNIPVVVDEDRLTDSPLLANREVRLCMADFVALRRFALEEEIGLEPVLDRPPAGIKPKGPRIATEYDCQPTRARGVLRYIARGLWDRPPQAMLGDNLGPRLWRFNHTTGHYVVTDRRTRGEA